MVAHMADQTNPYTQLGMMGMMMPNPYTQYGGKPLPIPGYMGTPTDAQGTPIQSYTDAAKQQPAAPVQGTTLNSTPQQPQFLYQQTSAGGMIPSGENTGLDHPQYNPATYGYVPNPAYQAQPAAPAAPAAPAGPRHAPSLPHRAVQPRQGDGPRRDRAAGAAARLAVGDERLSRSQPQRRFLGRRGL